MKQIAALFAGALVCASLVASADAKSTPKYVYVVTAVEGAEGVTGAPTDEVRDGIAVGMTRTEEIVPMPEGAPDPAAEPAKFKAFLKKKKLSAFHVNVEIIAYEKSTETTERGNKRVGVHIELRLFGETMPDRVMAFAGSGSATVKLDVGKKVRTVDAKAANSEAIEVAVGDALAESLKKLAEPKKASKKRAKK